MKPRSSRAERLLFGLHSIEELIRSNPEAISRVVIAKPHTRSGEKIASLAHERRVAIEEHPIQVLHQMCDRERHQGVIAVCRPFTYASFEGVLSAVHADTVILAVDGVQDPRNLGAIIRSAVAFGAAAVILPQDRSSEVTPTVVQTSAGSTEHASVVQVTNLSRALETLAKRNLFVIGLAADGESDIAAVGRGPRGTVLVVGSEGAGMRALTRKRCDVVARIAYPGPVESLNASVATAVALYELVRDIRMR